MSSHGKLNHREELLLQAAGTIELINELCIKNFIKSDFYIKEVESPLAKYVIDTCGIDNQGMAVLSLYALLVVPSESFMTDFKAKFDILNKHIDSICINSNSTYLTDMDGIDYIRHMRNAVAHNNIKFEPTKYVEFSDKNEVKENGKKIRDETCLFQIPLSQLGSLMKRLRDNIIEFSNRTLEIK